MTCGARLFIGDDFGDNTSTMRCQLDPGHPGPHTEVFIRRDRPVTITWEVDEREDCEKHGLSDASYCETCQEEWSKEFYAAHGLATPEEFSRVLARVVGEK